MGENPEVVTPVSVTQETIIVSKTTVHFAPITPFVARVHKVQTRRGKGYSILRMTIPKEIGEKMEIKDKEFLFLLAQKAQWFHMIDWTRMPETFAKLPVSVRGALEASGLVPTFGAAPSPSITGGVLSPLQLDTPSNSQNLRQFEKPATA